MLTDGRGGGGGGGAKSYECEKAWASINHSIFSEEHKYTSTEAEFMNVQFFVEVSRHNLESSQTCGFCVDFLNHSEGVGFSVRFSSVETVRGCVSLKK